MKVSRRSGFTLMELLTVLALFSILLGIGVGAFKQLALGRALAVTQVKDAVRSARLFALEQSSSSRVDLVKGEGESLGDDFMVSSGFISVGDWHFEDSLSTGWPTTAELPVGSALINDGAIGKGIILSDEVPGIILLGSSPAFDADKGVRAEAFIKVDEGSGGKIISKGDAFSLRINGDRTLTASVRVTDEEGSRIVPEMISCSSTHPIPQGRWVRTGMSFDGGTLRIQIGGREDGILRLQKPRAMVPDPAAPLVAGSTQPPFYGGIDEVKLASVISDVSPKLPDGVTFASVGTIYFDGRGRLDPDHHARPVTIVLSYDNETRTREIEVGLLGEVK